MLAQAVYEGAPLPGDGSGSWDLAETLVAAAERHPGAAVVSATGRGTANAVGYPDFLDRARRWSTGLRRHGLRPGDHAVLAGLDDPVDYLTAFWACALGGIRPILAAPGRDAAAIDGVRRLSGRLAELPGDPPVLCDPHTAAALGAGVRAIDVSAMTIRPPATDLHRADPGDVAMLMMSSGSTGDPKLIQLTHRGLGEFVAGTPAVLPIRPGDTTVNWLPLDHSGAFLLYHLLAVAVGCTNVHAPTDAVLADPLVWLDLVEEHRAAHTWAPNFAYRMVDEALAGSPDRSWDLSCVRTLVSGGEQITEPVMAGFLRSTAGFGIRPAAFVPAWGMTETATGIAFARPGLTPNVCRVRTPDLDGQPEPVDDAGDEHTTTYVAVGGPAPGATLRVIDEHGAVLPEGRVGRLQVASARVTPGYLGDPAADERALSADPSGKVWLNTRDLAFGHAGQIVVVGRESDRIVLRGQNHYAHEIESAVADVPGVLPGLIAACGVPDRATGTDGLVVFVAVEPGGDPAATAGAVEERLFGGLRLTGRVVPVPREAFPVTPGGKVQRALLRKRLLDGDLPVVAARLAAPAAPRGPVTAGPTGERRRRRAVLEVLRGVLGEEVDERARFHEVGVDSVTMVRMHAALERALGAGVPRSAMFEYPSMAALADHLTTLPAGPAQVTGPAQLPPGEHRVAIIGMALRFPGADTLDEFWANLVDGVGSVRRFTPEELAAAGLPAAEYTRPDFVPVTGALAGIDEFDAGYFGISPAEAARTDPAHRLFLQSCVHALEHGGYAGRDDGSRIGVYAGSGMNLYTHRTYLLGNLLDSVDGDPVTAMQAAIGTQPDFLATRVAYRLGLTGPAIGVQTACSTSLVAVHLAAQAVAAGDVDMALAGAAAVHVPQAAGYRHHPGSILSPTGRCRAFDAAADGTVGGNGTAAVLLKRLDRALADGDTVHAVIIGSAVNNDGADKVGFTAPGVSGQAAVIGQAIDRAGVPAETITYLEAHGTGTALGDPVELRAAARALRDRTDRVGFCTVGSVKPNIGHLDSCAGMAGLLKTVLMLGHRTLVPLVNFDRPNPGLDLDGSPLTLGTTARAWPADGAPRRAGVTALGVGGTNAHVILEEAPPAPPGDGPDDLPRPAVLPLSAAHPEALAELAGRMRDHLRTHPRVPVADLVTTAALGRSHHRYRAAVVGATATELADALDGLVPPAAAPGAPARPVFAFCGQGPARPGMAGELYDTFPRFREILDECEQVYRQETGGSLLAPLRDPRPAADCWATDVAQPALFAFQVALAGLWRSFGVEPASVVGHSIGEYAALCVAGALTTEDALRLVVVRGRLMHSTQPGAMVAVVADRAVVEEVLAYAQVEVAAVNGPGEFVLTGGVAAIRRATAWLGERGIGHRPLPVDRAFHSALLDPVLDEFARAVAAVAVTPLRIPLAGTVDGQLLAAGTVPDDDYLRRQMRAPVRFADALDALAGAGCDTFLEIGPDAVLTGIGRRTLPGSAWIPTGRPGTGPVRAVHLAVAELYRGGADLDWRALAGGGRRIPLPGYPFRPDRHWTEAGQPVAVIAPEVVAPAEPALARICELTADQLGLAPNGVGADDTFLDLGADSLAMLKLVQQVRQSLGADIAVRRLFTDAATPRALCAAIGAGAAPEAVDRGSAAPAVVPDAGEPGTIDTVIAGQLEVAGRLVDQLTTLMHDQLALLRDRPVAGTAVELAAEPEPEHSARTGGADFSLFFFGDYPDQDGTDKYDAIVRAARFADQHGFHGLWLPERHFHSFGGLFPNPVVLAAALARETSRIRLNAGSVVLPLHHPLRVAEEWSVVDNLSGGRVGLCVASGWHANDFALNPDAYGRHRELMYEHLDTVRTLWSGAAVSARSGSGEQVDLRIYPRPVQAEPPLYTAVVSNPDSYRAAARAGLGVVTNLMVQSIDQLAANIELYRRTRAEHGLAADGGRVVVLVHTYLGTDLDRARTEAYEPFCRYLRSSLSLFGQVTNSLGLHIDENTAPEDVDFLLDLAYQRYCADRALIGTVDSTAPIADRLAEVGADEIACFVDFGVPAEQMLGSLAIVDQARRRHQARPGAAVAVRERPEPEVAPLSAAQRGMWFMEQLNPGSAGYHEPKAIRLDGPLDAATLRGALARVVDRHAALRTVFRDLDGEVRQVVLAEVEVDLPLIELPGTPEEQAVRTALRTMSAEPFDLATGPLLRAALVRLGEQCHLLVLSVHHAVFDSSSTAVLLRDLAAYYRSGPAGPDPLPPLPVSYPQHVRDRARQPGRAGEDRAFWQRAMAGAPPLELPTDRPRTAAAEPAGAWLSHDFDDDLAETVNRFSRHQRVTPFMTLAAAVAGVLGRFGAQDDIVLGTALSHRPPGTEDLVGLFIDSVPLRVDLSGDPSLGTLAHRVRETSIEAYDHAGIGFDELVSAVNPGRDPGRNPLFQVLVEYEDRTEVAFDPPDLRATVIDVPSDRAPLDITIYLSHHRGRLHCLVEYRADLFDASTVRGLLNAVGTLLRRATTTPALPLARLTAPDEAERATIASWSVRRHEEEPAVLHQLFERQARRTPDAVALLTGDGELTYRELDRRANALAWRLHDRGLRPEEFVAVCLPRGAGLIVALLAVLKAGRAYLPLDRAVPQARLALMVRDSGAAVLVTDDDALATRLGLPALAVDGDDPRAGRSPDVPVGPDDPAYCIYTSGSTGRPKGVAVPHRGPANLVSWYLRNRPALRTLQWTSPSFDVSVQEIFTTLAGGAALVLINDETRYEPARIAETVRRSGVQRLFMTFTALKYLIERDPELPSLREIVSAGEELILTPDLRRFLADRPDCALYNEYGPTEAAIIATVHRVDPAAGDHPPVGRPVDNVEVHVLDAAREPVPVGAVGEIYLAGRGLAPGYLGRPEETREAFVTAAAVPGRVLYRTRDRGRWLADGTLQFLGRTDDQVKIRGYRVEPGEVTRALLDLPAVRDAAVVAGIDPSGEKCLIAYVVPAAGGPAVSGAELARGLAGTLPGYLIPAAWVGLTELPVNASGKLDRGALPEPRWNDESGSRPATALEETLHDLWCADLGAAEVSVDASYFALGGHSLTAVRLVERMREHLGADLSVAALFRTPTIRALAAQLDRPGAPEIAPASSFQERAWRVHHDNPRPAVYNVAHRITLTGEVDVTALRRALAALVRRHAALRTHLVAADGEVRQVIAAEVPVDLPVTRLGPDATEVDAWCQAEADTAFTLSEPPLWRAHLAQSGAGHWTLMLVLHHAICDGWSMGVLWAELSALYGGEVAGERVELPEAGTYPDHVRWRLAEINRRRDGLVEFWRSRLAGASLRAALPYDRPRPAELSGRGAVHRLEMPVHVADLVRQVAQECAATPAAVLTAAFGVWLGRTCRQDDLVLAVSSAGRIRPEHARVVGPVGEALLVRLTVRDGTPFRDLVRQANERTFDALDHGLLPLREVGAAIGADLRTPQVLFTVVTTAPAQVTLPGIVATVEGVAVSEVARTELYVVLAPDDDGVSVAFEYSTDLFDEQTIKQWAEDFVAVVDRACRSARAAGAATP